MSRTIWQRIARWWVRRSKSRSRHRDDLGPKSHWTTNAHYQNYGCEQISSEDIPIIFWRYFYVTNRYDNLELVDLYSDVENDPNKPRTLQELSIIMARERLKFWLNYKMSLFSFHYCDFVKLQNTLLTTIGIQLAISKLILPSLREPRHTLKFPDNKLFHKWPGVLFFGELRRYSGQFHGYNPDYFGPELFANEYVLWACLFALIVEENREHRVIKYISECVVRLRPSRRLFFVSLFPDVVLPNDTIYCYPAGKPIPLRAEMGYMITRHHGGGHITTTNHFPIRPMVGDLS